jgi:coiled-coil domain-containing protein 55
MPALAFGLKGSKPSLSATKPAQKRKAVFGDAGSDDDQDSPQPPPQAGAKKSIRPLKPLQPLKDDTSSSDEDGSAARPAKSPKLSHPASSTSYGLQKNPPSTKPAAAAPPATSTDTNDFKDRDKYTNLSSLRSAQLHASATASLDPSVYDYDTHYDTFHSSSTKPSSNKNASDSSGGGPKYMTSLLATTQQRKRDHERAREKAVQRERENEGDEFAGKESFVTGAYKRQQEEMRQAEEEEERRVQEEEERRRKGEGMLGFRKMMLEKEEERMRAIQEAEERRKEVVGKEGGESSPGEAGEDGEDAARKAKELNEHGARIALNEEGEVIDKRQLLTAGLNVAPKKPSASTISASTTSNKPSATDAAGRPRGNVSGDSRAAQRERQTRMVERQLEAAAEAQRADEEREEKERLEKNKSKIGEAEKMSAKERYLARKREREAEAAEGKKKGG